MSRLFEDMKKAIEDSPTSRYQMAKDTGISEPALCQFVNGTRGMTIDRLEMLAEYLGLEIVVRPKSGGKK